MLKSCPSCGYSLTGLPSEHRCPECGLRYDEHSAQWLRYRRRRVVAVAGAGCATLVYYLIGVSGWLTSSSRVIDLLFSALAPGLVAFSLFVFARGMLRLWWGGHVAAVAPEKLIWRVDSTGDHTVLWSNVSRVAVKPSPVGIVVFLKREKSVIDIVGPFKNKEEAEQFVASAKVYIEVAKNACEVDAARARCT